MLQYQEQMERSSKDRLQGLAPEVRAGLGESGPDASSKEVLWLFVRNKLMMEQENGEHIPGRRAGLLPLTAPLPVCGVVPTRGTHTSFTLRTSIVNPFHCWEN